MALKKCSECNGSGKITVSEKTCPDCKGLGSAKIVLSSYSSNNDGKCKKCNGIGVLRKVEDCTTCNSSGRVRVCDLCGEVIGPPTGQKTQDICKECRKSPVVYKLRPPCTYKSINVGSYYKGKIKNFKDFGVFVELFPGMDGLIRTRNLKGIKREDIGKETLVKVKAMTRDGKIELLPLELEDFRIRFKRDPIERKQISELNRKMQNETVLIQGEVSQIRQTSGPISYNFVDESGSITGVAFVKPSEENPYASIELEDIVEVVGVISTHRDVLQIEINDMVEADDHETKIIQKRIEQALEEKSTPKDISFLIEDPILENMKKDLYKLAKMIRRAIFNGTPILLRHHADTDGITCAVAIEHAIISILQNEQPDAIDYRIKRSPSKAPFWDFIDVTKDLDYALQDANKYGDKLPLVILLDLGSSHESLASIKKAQLFGINVAVLDHHFPEKIIKENVSLHVNPYFEDGDYNLCAGMLGVELARIINPDISDKIDYLPAIAGIADHVEGKVLEQYLEIAKNKKLPFEFLEKMADAIDYEQYYLRFSDGKNIIDTILGFEELYSDNHKKLVNLLATEARQAIDQQLDICMAHLKKSELPNGVLLGQIDVEKYAKKFAFPPPGKTTGAIHDIICENQPETGVITLGLGPDFVVLRSRDVLMNFPKLIGKLKNQMPSAGIDGGGHEVVGSLKFIEGMRDKVIETLITLLGKTKSNITEKTNG
ncbi:MAG: DHH family phosphoesterase [Asgard group archaeon]|nr:DHH family phosphoesterase [Asgard group archaeon]